MTGGGPPPPGPALLARALRLPFLGASLLPCLAGALAQAGGRPRLLPLGLALACVGFTHLAANLVNDYADAASGADARDLRYFGLFGGSKLIQEGRLSASFYLNGARACAALAALAALAAALWLRQAAVLAWFALALALAWSYSHGPLRLACRGLGELAVFLLFGPLACAAGAYLQAGGLPPPEIWLSGVPHGLLTAAVLVANEVPDAADDAAVGKRTLVVRLGAAQGWRLYAAVMLGAGAAVLCAVWRQQLHPAGLAALLALPAAWGAARILRHAAGDKRVCLRASRLAIGVQLAAGTALCLAAALS